jgi:predicted ester cyclase
MRNYDRDPARIEALIVAEMEAHPDYNNTFAHNLHFGALKHWIDYSKFSEKGIAFLVRWLIKLPDFDWQIQDLVADLGRKDVHIVYDILWGRIDSGARQKQETLSIVDRVRYEAIPYHFSDGIRKFFADNPDAKVIIQNLIAHATKEWSTINWDIGHLLERVGYSFRQAFDDLLKEGGDDNLFKAVGLMNFVDGGEMDLCMEIAGRTDNPEILGSVRSLLYATGVVSGEDGIARAYASKADAMKPYLESDNPRIKKFAEEMHKNFVESAKAEQKRVAEQKQLRKIEFEG